MDNCPNLDCAEHSFHHYEGCYSCGFNDGVLACQCNTETEAQDVKTLKAVGEYLTTHKCPHKDVKVPMNFCYDCMLELRIALKQGRMP